MSITDVPGLRVGHWTNTVARTGCTVVVPPRPNVATVEVRGAAPGSRETALLAPGMRVEEIHALVFTGGSAYGLAAADGVMRELAADGVGHQTPWGVVPIVPAAVVFDLNVGDPAAHPGPEHGASAYRAASTEAVSTGPVGAGAGATVGKWRGIESGIDAGLGSASLAAGQATVGVLAVVNAVGDVRTLEGEPVTGPGPGPSEWSAAGALQNTTLVALATDARVDRAELTRLAVRSHDALGACLRPAHTRYDGDAVFVISCGEVVADLDVLGEAAFAATGAAIASACRAP